MLDGRKTSPRLIGMLLLAAWLSLTFGEMARAVGMQNDPNGFEGVPWGSRFGESDTFEKVEDTGWIQSYELKGKTPVLGNVAVDQLRFMTVEGKFARVTVRYHGPETHQQLMVYLQQRFGPLDQTPGQIAGGNVHMFAWRGFDTEITLRYEKRTDQGIIFFESQTYRSRLSEGNSATVF